MEVLSTSRRALVLALALLLTACPKTTTPVRGGGGTEVPTEHGEHGETTPPTRPRVEAKKDNAADAALAQAIETAARTPDKKQAAEVLLAVRKAYPDTTASQEALYRAGVLYFESEDYANARKAFNELLFENPLHPQAEDAKRKLALSALEVGAYRDAYQTLSSLAERAPQGPERDKLLGDAERAAEGAGMYGAALDIAVKVAGDAKTPEAQAAAVARVEQLVEGRASFVDIARVAEGMSPRHPAWPVLTFKLARIYYHLRDWTRLEETLQRFLQEAPSLSVRRAGPGAARARHPPRGRAAQDGGRAAADERAATSPSARRCCAACSSALNGQRHRAGRQGHPGRGDAGRPGHGAARLRRGRHRRAGAAAAG